MKRDLILKIAASSMVFGIVLSGCGPFGGESIASVSSTSASAKDGAKYAKKAEKALAKGDIESAISFAERSVAGVGSDSETRALLGNAYLAAGRFASAERSFQDAMELGKIDARTILSLSLAQLGQGKAEQAKTLVVNNRQFIPASDYGLALAMSGDSKTAVSVLEQIVRGPNADGRARQNLGLAYALDGRWKEAKLMVSQDVAPELVNDRIMEWAQMARPGAYQSRVATVLNVTPVANDPGQPVQLALKQVYAPTNVADSSLGENDREMASIDNSRPLPAVGPAPTADADVDFLAKEDNVKVATVAVPASKPAVKTPAAVPEVKAVVEPAPVASKSKFVVTPNMVAPVKTAANGETPAAKPVMQRISYQPATKAVASASGTHLVQLGAFSSPESAKRAWRILSSKNRDLQPFQYASSRVKVKGRTLYRLAAIGFGNAETAEAMCVGIKAKGGNCIVRHAKGVNKIAPSRMASRKATKLASR